MDWTEKQQCVLCDRGGDLLVCNGDGCPISVHKSCMGCKAYMDDGGNFHCPYCVYKQFMAEISQSREKALSTKKRLSIFLEKELRHQQEPIVGMANKEKETSSKEKLVDVNNHVCDDVQNRCAEKHQQSKTPLRCQETRDIFISEQTNVNTCRIMVLYNSNSNAPDASGLDCKSYKEGCVKVDQLESDVSKKTKVDNQTGNANQQRDTSTEEAAQSKSDDVGSSVEKKITLITLRKRKQSVACKKSGRSKRRKECMMENGAETLESLQNGTKLQSKPHSRIDPNGARKGSLETKSINISNPKELKDSSKPQSKPDGKINHNDLDSLLDHPSGARKVSLETKSINISIPKEFKDSSKPQSKPDRKIDHHNDSDSLLGHPSGARKGSLKTKSTNVSNSEGLKDSSLDRIIKLPLQTGKQRILWTVQEEDMLKEGVQKFSSSERKNLPWKKILDFGRHVFHPYRNPSDLKDKWRKIAK